MPGQEYLLDADIEVVATSVNGLRTTREAPAASPLTYLPRRRPLRNDMVPPHASRDTPSRNKVPRAQSLSGSLNGSRPYFAGDSGFGSHFADIATRFQGVDLALLPIGAYEPEWFMGAIHMTPEQAIETQRMLNAPTAIATHFGTFPLADDGMAAPTDRLQTALRDHPPTGSFLVLPEGGSWHLVPPHVDPE